MVILFVLATLISRQVACQHVVVLRRISCDAFPTGIKPSHQQKQPARHFDPHPGLLVGAAPLFTVADAVALAVILLGHSVLKMHGIGGNERTDKLATLDARADLELHKVVDHSS